LKWGAVGEREKRMGREGGGGRSLHKQPGTRVDGIAPCSKEGLQISKRGFGNKGGTFQAKGEYQGDYQGDYQRDCAICLR
jgi:hypothetical protein